MWDTRNRMRCREFWVQFYGSKCVICRYVLKGQVKLFTHQLLTEFLLIAEDPRLCMKMKSLLSWNLLSAWSWHLIKCWTNKWPPRWVMTARVRAERDQRRHSDVIGKPVCYGLCPKGRTVGTLVQCMAPR